MERRDILKLGALAVGASVMSGCATTKELEPTLPLNKVNKNKRVIIIGGGYAGLSVAKNIRIHNKDSEILLFESKNIFASCPYSNLYFGGLKDVSYEHLLFSPLEGARRYNYSVINQKVISVDRKKRTITTDKESYEYDLLVMATGIEYDYSDFFKDEDSRRQCYNLYPPSYQGGFEQLTLKKKIENFSGGVFLINVPKGAYRCPPAPYERACMIAHSFKQRGIKGKVVLLDPRDKPTTKAKGFISAFQELYSEYIEYLPSSHIKEIDIKDKKVIFETFGKDGKFDKKELTFEDANIIPQNRPTKLLVDAGLEVNKDGWGRVKAPGFESLNDQFIYIVGDLLGEYPYPKSGQMANSCGTILGKQIAFRLSNTPYEIGSEMPSNVCYSMVSDTEAIAVNHYASYSKTDGVKVQVELHERRDRLMGEATKSWYKGITSSIFE